MKLPIFRPRAGLLLALFALTLAVSHLPRRTPLLARAQGLEPAGELRELSIDDGSAEYILGDPADRAMPQSGRPGFGWVNKLTPAQYPATLRSITIGFNRVGEPGNEVRPDALYRIVVFRDPEKDGPANEQVPDASFTGRARGTTDVFMTFNLISPLTITEGSFVIGAIDEIGQAGYPALADAPGKSTPPGSEAFWTFDGGTTWGRLADVMFPVPNPPGSFLIRATVELLQADTLTVTQTIADPKAVEPWSAAANQAATDVLVTNLVSDNVTAIKTVNNGLVNIPVGDGPGGTPDGPWGVIFRPDGNRVYVTMIGTNTIPSKEFPLDYAALPAGRVQVLAIQAGGSFTPSAQINVGKGPLFPAVSLDGARLYVPCAGDNRVDVINTATNEKIKEIPVGRQPTSCAVSLDGTRLYVTNHADGTVSVINTATEQKVKDIGLPFAAPLPFGLWKGAVSPLNGNLYITGPSPGGLVVVDTCKDEFLRLLSDDSTRETPAGSAGASGLSAPSAPLERDAATGLTPGAGGGGGGPFGIAPLRGTPMMVFTNDGLGIVGALDARTDQVVSAPALALETCPKPRDLVGVPIPQPTPPGGQPLTLYFAYVACGQPANTVAVVRVPPLPENLPNFPGPFTALLAGSGVNLTGVNFTRDMRVQLLGARGAGGASCVGFEKVPKIKKSSTLLKQRGRLVDGRSLTQALSDAPQPYIRLVAPDGSARVVRCCATN